MSTILYIKSMVCIRCKMAVEAVLNSAGVNFVSVVLGKAVLAQELTPAQKVKVQEGLKHYELELLGNKTLMLVEEIKTQIIYILHRDEPMTLKLSVFLSKALEYNYTYLANTFAANEGITLERYFINQRIERAKELMFYGGLSITQIAYDLGYSNASHFSAQFKKVAGISPGEFKKLCRIDNFVWRALP